MKKKPSRRDAEQPAAAGTPARHSATTETAGLRVIGGLLRGRKIAYLGDPRTRPMKDRTREAIFNLLTTDVIGAFVLDVFAGTGALGIEALSRGATAAVFFEKHFPTADVLRKTLQELGIDDRGTITACNAFLQVRKLRRDGSTLPADRPWILFCSPPYDFYVDRADEMAALLDDLLALAPARSLIVVEADGRFDTDTLPAAAEWRVREYPPAVVAIYQKPASPAV